MGDHSHSHSSTEIHNHGGIFGPKTELIFSILAGIFLIITFLLESFEFISEPLAIGLYIVSYFFGGYYAAIEAWVKTIKGEFEIDFLMIVAAIGAAYIGSWAEGALLLFLFSLGHALENHALNKAKKSIEALGNLSPTTAFIKDNGELKEIPIEELKIGDVIVVKPNAKIAADGVIIEGYSSINQAPITGESIPVEKSAITYLDNLPPFEKIEKNHVVYTGTINGDNVIEVKVLKLSSDSTISRLIDMVSKVETNKSPTQRVTKKFEKWYVPVVIIMVIVLCFAFLVIDETFNESLYRAICALVAASPCALAISTPSAVLSGVARAANKGVLIKGGKALEDLGTLKTIAFDKTGTLTEGRPKLTNTIVFNGLPKEEFLQMVYAVESMSNHPLARAISRDLRNQNGINTSLKAENIQAVHGMGIKAVFKNQLVYIGNEKLLDSLQLNLTEEIQETLGSLRTEGHTAMLVARENELLGLVSVMDVPRKTVPNTLKRLKSLGISKMIMLTGDHQNVGSAIAKEIGLTEARGNLLPEDKVEAIEELKKRDSKIAMVGDGVNDAPAMASSTVGIAMGAAGSDVALETADVALMSDKIERLPFVIGLSRASKRIITQNLWISLGVVALLVPATIIGMANIGIAVVFHEGSTIVVVLNALRLLAYNDKTI
ncbi:heavy metal translocating P-type ATPase [Aegicerativicinus sediminis]